jgi:hypothetical protein
MVMPTECGFSDEDAMAQSMNVNETRAKRITIKWNKLRASGL